VGAMGAGVPGLPGAAPRPTITPGTVPATPGRSR
jgi:hypothetical protein